MQAPVVGVIMGSESDLAWVEPGLDLLNTFGIPHEVRVVSAHRTPNQMVEYAESARKRGLKVIIAAAGGAAHLPGMVASLTTLPVIGVPIPTKQLGGNDSLLSIVQMPAGVPVATVGIGNGANAALLAAQVLSLGDTVLTKKLEEYKASLIEKVAHMNERLETQLGSS